MDAKAAVLGILVIVVGFLPPAGAANLGPKNQVRVTVDGILAILRDKTLDWHAKQLSIESIIDRRFDFQTISQSVLATHWRKATPEERRRFVEFFSQYLQHTYTEKMRQYTDQYVKYGSEKVKGERAVVDTFIVTENVDIPVTYKLRLDAGKWYAYDVVIEGVSLVSNYRNTYGAIVKSEGIDGLLESLEQSIKEYRATPGSERRP